jgi:hypothetical protein
MARVLLATAVQIRSPPGNALGSTNWMVLHSRVELAAFTRISAALCAVLNLVCSVETLPEFHNTDFSGLSVVSQVQHHHREGEEQTPVMSCTPPESRENSSTDVAVCDTVSRRNQA